MIVADIVAADCNWKYDEIRSFPSELVEMVVVHDDSLHV